MAALITADADATMAADVITDVDVTVDGDFQAEIIPAVISSGSSSFCACAETITADAAMAAADVATVTTAGSLSFSSACVAMAADAITAAADRLPLFPSRAEVNPSAFGDGYPICHNQIQYLFQLLPFFARIPDLFHKRNSPPLPVFPSDPSFSLPLSFCL